jgi:hypothetical protein
LRVSQVVTLIVVKCQAQLTLIAAHKSKHSIRISVHQILRSKKPKHKGHGILHKYEATRNKSEK